MRTKMRAEPARRADGTIDLDEAQHFLDLLEAKQCTFQTFDDHAKRKAPNLACIRHGRLADHADELIELNERGAGVFDTGRRGRVTWPAFGHTR